LGRRPESGAAGMQGGKSEPVKLSVCSPQARLALFVESLRPLELNTKSKGRSSHGM